MYLRGEQRSKTNQTDRQRDGESGSARARAAPHLLLEPSLLDAAQEVVEVGDRGDVVVVRLEGNVRVDVLERLLRGLHLHTHTHTHKHAHTHRTSRDAQE